MLKNKIRYGVILVSALLTFFSAEAEKRIFLTGINPVELIIDGVKTSTGWTILPDMNPDILETTADSIRFISDKDSITISGLKDWECFDFAMLTEKGDSANVRVKRIAANPFENPDPGLIKIAPSGNLSKEQAAFDIDALIYTLSEIHPDIFSICKQEDLFRAVNNVKKSLPDSISKLELYRKTAPIVAMIGDGHTNMVFPSKSILTPESKRFPVFVDVFTDRSLICTSSLDSIIRRGDRIVSVNGISSDSIINAMMPFVSGERPHFRIARIDHSFTGLFQMLFAADEYDVKYIPQNTKEVLSYRFPAVTFDEIKKRCPTTKTGKKSSNYSYTIDSINNVAIMDFRSFSDVDRMEQFADSMFSDLRNRGIKNLIIDIRNNGGGNSSVGDVLLKYISSKPFEQMDKALIRVTPLTAKLLGNPDVSPMFVFFEVDPSKYKQPRTKEEGHYDGNVYLLTSNHTFSSAGSFAWAFKQAEMGTVIGEETGGMNVCYGDILTYKLPVSNLTTSISFKRFWQMGADENDIHGTIPDIEVPAADALNAAMKLIKGK